MNRVGRSVAVLLAAGVVGVGAARAAHAQSPAVTETPRPPTADLKAHLREASDASAHRNWEEATSQLREAVKLAPDDARLREKLRRVLDGRARAREATAAHPPPPPVGMADGPRGGVVGIMLEKRRWHAVLKHAALEARAEAEAARPHPDEGKLAQLRRDLSAVEAEQAEMAQAVAAEQRRGVEDQAAAEKAFEGVGGLGVGGSRPPDAGLR